MTLRFFGCSRYDDGDYWPTGAGGAWEPRKGELWILNADPAIRCYGRRHRRWAWFVGLMICVYPVGVPLAYFVVLWRLRHLLNPQESDLSDAERAPLSAILDAEEDAVPPELVRSGDELAILDHADAPPPGGRPATRDVGGEGFCNLNFQEGFCFGGGGGDDGGDDAGFGEILHVDDAPPQHSPPGARRRRELGRREVGAAAPAGDAPAAPDAPPPGERSMSLVVREQRRSLFDRARERLRAPIFQAALLEHREVHSREAVAHVSFLVEEYEPRCYLFSVFECLRRIAMTGGLTIFADGGALQIAAGLFVAIVSHRVYSAYEPYISDDDDVLSEVAQTQLVFTFFGSLLLYVEANTEGERGYAGDVFGVIMLLVMLSGFFSACYFVLLDALGREKTRQLQRDFELRMSSSVAAARTSIHELFSDDSAAAVKAPPS